jgi:S1-C subfamily serine protease
MISRKQLEELAAAINGVAVCGCLPGSTAADAGVRYGDVVLQVNGVPTPTIDDYLEARKLRTYGYDLRLFRNGSEFTLFVAFRPPQNSLLALLGMLADGRYASPVHTENIKKPLPS